MYVCMCAQVWEGVKVCVGMFVPWHSHGNEKKDFHWLIFSFHLTLRQFLADSRLAGPQLLAGSPSFSSHLSEGAQGLQMFTSMSGFRRESGF